LFGDVSFSKDARILVTKSGDLSQLDKSILEPALNSDIYIVFGASYIRGWLIDYLISAKAINIHMGISPFYRGSSCNFWALHDNNPHLVGATVHMLGRGLDDGDLLYHVFPPISECANSFEFTMASVKAAHQSLVERIANNTLFKYKLIKQNPNLLIRYSRNHDFTDEVAKEFLGRNPSIEQLSMLIREKGGETTDLITPYYNP